MAETTLKVEHKVEDADLCNAHVEPYPFKPRTCIITYITLRGIQIRLCEDCLAILKGELK